MEEIYDPMVCVATDLAVHDSRVLLENKNGIRRKKLRSIRGDEKPRYKSRFINELESGAIVVKNPTSILTVLEKIPNDKNQKKRLEL